MDNFGKKIKDLRIEHGLSQKELAKNISISGSNLSQWESMAIPPLEGIIKVCAALNIPLWKFFIDDITELKEYLPSFIKKEHFDFLKELNELPPDVHKQLLEHFKGIISVQKYL